MTDDGRELLERGAAAYAAGDVRAALRVFEAAAASSSGDLRISALVNAAGMSDELGDHRHAIAAYRQALADLPGDAVRLRSATLVNLSQALQHTGDLAGAQSVLEEARDLLTGAAGEERTFVACLLSLTAVAIHRHEWAAAEQCAREALAATRLHAPELAGHPLLNLAAVHFETGRLQHAFDCATQARAAFESVGDRNGIAETEQNLGLMYLRTDRADDAADLLARSQTYFEPVGNVYRSAIGAKAIAFVSDMRGDSERAAELYRQSLGRFTAAGAELDAADVRIRLATTAFASGNQREGEQLIDVAYRAYADRGLGLQCAQIDYWHAALLESTGEQQYLSFAVALAVPAAIAIDAIRYTFPTGYRRERWNRRVAEPALQLAFRLAYTVGDATLLADLIETQCAGTTPDLANQPEPVASALPFDLLEAPDGGPGADALGLGFALAGVAADAGLAVTVPPRLADASGRVLLDGFVATAQARYGFAVRTERVLPTW